MKEYKMVYLSRGLKLSKAKDLEQPETILNKWVSAGWELQQVVSPSDMGGALVAIFYRER